jgi:hypothetical protein
MESQDSETLAVLARASAIKETLKTEGWPLIEGMLIRKIEDLNSIENIPLEDMKTNDELVQQIAIRHGAIRLMREWLAEVKRLTGYADAYVRINQAQEEDTIIVQS